MDSELTLVNPPSPVCYFLSSTDLTDSVIFAEPGLPLYRVNSDEKHIKIYDSTLPNRIVAIFHRRDIFSDMIYFPSQHGGNGSSTGKRLSIQRWLKQSKMPDGTTVFMVDTERGRSVWKMTSRHHFEVFAYHDLENPIALCYLNRSLPPNQPAFILQPAGEPLRDDIVVAYLVQRFRVMLGAKSVMPFSTSRNMNAAHNPIPIYGMPGVTGIPNFFLPSLSFDFRTL